MQTPTVHVRVDTTPSPARDGRYDGVARTAIGVLGSAAGTLGGAYLGTSLPHGPCNCDDPGLEQALLGAAVGSVVGASILAAVPRLASTCSSEKRFGLALVSAAGGALVGGLLGGAVYSGGGVVVGWMSGAAVGAGFGATVCGRK